MVLVVVDHSLQELRSMLLSFYLSIQYL
jgi:hypothetical protein